jgi:hypothetical protein
MATRQEVVPLGLLSALTKIVPQRRAGLLCPAIEQYGCMRTAPPAAAVVWLRNFVPSFEHLKCRYFMPVTSNTWYL